MVRVPVGERLDDGFFRVCRSVTRHRRSEAHRNPTRPYGALQSGFSIFLWRLYARGVLDSVAHQFASARCIMNSVEPNLADESYYAPHQKVYPREVEGTFSRLRVSAA